MKFWAWLRTVAILPMLALVGAASARADPFGCTVLLCVLNPGGWASVGTCVPPVQEAFRRIARGQPWPQCPEAGSNGRIGYERFDQCPAGSAPAERIDMATLGDAVRPVFRPAAELVGQGGYCVSGAPGPDGLYTAAKARPERVDPNYVDIVSSSGNQRVWFNMRGYQ